MGDQGDKPNTAGSITYQQDDVPQPRQPQSLQGLLRFAMEATKHEDAPEPSQFDPITEEKKRFLENALKSLTVDVVELLQKNMNVLLNAGNLSIDSDIEEYLNAFESICDYIGQIDTANDFHKIGGLSIFEPCFKCVHGSIRARACDLLAELCQNNPYWQRVVLDSNLMKSLVDIVGNDPDDEARTKAVYAISCNVRENETSAKRLIELNGPTLLLNGLRSPVDKLRTKCAFLLSWICSTYKEVKDQLLNNDGLATLTALLATDRTPNHEHLLALLVALITDHPGALQQCVQPRYGLKSILTNHLRIVDGKEDCLEEAQYCRLLLDTVFKGRNGADTDR